MPAHALKNLVKRGEIYYFRMAIPTGLQSQFECKEMKSSLRTDKGRDLFLSVSVIKSDDRVILSQRGFRIGIHVIGHNRTFLAFAVDHHMHRRGLRVRVTVL